MYDKITYDMRIPFLAELVLCRFGVEDTCSLLNDIGLADTSAFRINGVTGGDLLDLDATDLKDSLHLSALQVMTLKIHCLQCHTRVINSLHIASE